MTETKRDVAIEVGENGPYHVTGGVPLVRIVWLCRCGNSKIKPLCDGSHAETGFQDG